MDPHGSSQPRRLRLQRRYRFSASHLYRRPEWSEEENRRRFGKCANLPGHGHNYRLWVTVEGTVDPATGFVVDLGALDALVPERVIERLDHQHLNSALPEIRRRAVDPLQREPRPLDPRSARRPSAERRRPRRPPSGRGRGSGRRVAEILLTDEPMYAAGTRTRRRVNIMCLMRLDARTLISRGRSPEDSQDGYLRVRGAQVGQDLLQGADQIVACRPRSGGTPGTDCSSGPAT